VVIVNFPISQGSVTT